ncbi:hypothetical protein BEN71_14230 [Acinetobacter wuhouensis]|uniref:hypothetical protein n=1 Tax=Acinetobacter wuhouensis TaxID=1879050 RepID=UPI00083B016C|nr:hypothetical protein [Acinetobacter wuhouensis]AXQ23162.1 hypothetical protein BEN71_14230 [Acinetobacter wuhouensis]
MTTKNENFWNYIVSLKYEDAQKGFWDAGNKLETFIKRDKGFFDDVIGIASKVFLFHPIALAVTMNVDLIKNRDKSFIAGVLKGDFNQNPTTGQIIVGGVISLIPVVDQVCDVRDLIANIISIHDHNYQNAGDWFNLCITAVGFIPEFGSAIKTIVKLLKKGASKLNLLTLLKHMEKLFKNPLINKIKSKIPWGASPQTWLKKFDWKAAAKSAYDSTVKLMTKMRDGLQKIYQKGVKVAGDLVNTINGIFKSFKNKIDDFFADVKRGFDQLLQELNPKYATANGAPPPNVYNADKRGEGTGGSGSTNKHTRKDDDKKKDKKSDVDDDPCKLTPYGWNVCKPLNKTGHHVVPDRCFRLGPRSGQDRSQLTGGLSTNDGLAICVKGATPKPLNEHGKIHKKFSSLESTLKNVLQPKGTAPIAEVEVIGAKAVSFVLKKCTAVKMTTELRVYHQSKGINVNYRVRIGVFATDAKKANPGIFGNPKTKGNGGVRE